MTSDERKVESCCSRSSSSAAIWLRPSVLWFRLLHLGIPGPLLCAALGKPGRSFTRVTALAHERPRRLVIGHVLLHGHARNDAVDHVGRWKCHSVILAAPTI